MTEYIATYVAIALVIAGVESLFCFFESPFDGDVEKQAAFVILSAALWPLGFVGLICCGLWYGVPALGRGFTKLWRDVFPRKVKLPRAVARPGRVGVVVSNAVAEGDVIVVAQDGTYQGRKS